MPCSLHNRLAVLTRRPWWKKFTRDAIPLRNFKLAEQSWIFWNIYCRIAFPRAPKKKGHQVSSFYYSRFIAYLITHPSPQALRAREHQPSRVSCLMPNASRCQTLHAYTSKPSSAWMAWMIMLGSAELGKIPWAVPPRRSRFVYWILKQGAAMVQWNHVH